MSNGDKRSRAARIRRGLALVSFGIVIVVFALTAETPTLRCADGVCVVEQASFWIPHGETSFPVEAIQRVIEPGPWDHPMYFVELEDGRRISVHRSNPGRFQDFSSGVLRRFVAERPHDELTMETTGADAFWLFCIPFVVAGSVLFGYDDD